MTIVDFCHSDYGRGIKQAKLYRRLRRWVEQEIEEDLDEVMMDVEAYGFEVEEDGVGQLRYGIYDPRLFRPLALHLARSDERMLTAEDEGLVLEWLEQMMRLYTGQAETVMLVRRSTMKPVTVQANAEWEQLLQVIDKLR